MSASLGPVAGIWAAIQQRIVAVNGIATSLKTGILVVSAPPAYTVANRPATAATGATAWASNGRKPGEGAGAGTGCPVFFNAANSQWYSFLSGSQVTA